MQTLNKIAVAERQLSEAVRLHFERRDSVAVHTLASAAQGILRDIAKHQNLEHRSILHDNPMIDSELRKAWIDHLNQPRNYFKHADRDHGVDLLWDESANEGWLLDAVLLFHSVSGKSFLAAKVYLGWFTTKHPHLRSAVSGNEVGDFCAEHGIPMDNFAWFLEVLDNKEFQMPK